MQVDVITVSDFRFPGGTSGGIAHELRALHGAGYKVGLVQKRASILRQDRPFHPQIRACIDAGQCVLVNPADKVEAKLALLHNPYVFTEPQIGLPRISARRKVMIAQQPVLDSSGVPYYDVTKVQRVAEELVGEGVVWAPISPFSRRNMLDAGIPYEILSHDWNHVIFVADWATDRSAPVGSRPVIGRHSRSEWQKWPASREEMLAAYPEDEEFEVRLLGFGDAVAEVLGGRIPASWTTFPFNEIDPADFLRTIDFFVYYHHPDWAEGFGRTIAEAAASGAVLILPEHFRPTFGEAALYRQSWEVRDTVRTLYADWETYRLQSRLGQRLVDRMYGPAPFVARVEALIGKSGVETASPVKPAGAVVPPSFDVLHLGDLRTTRDTALRIANECRIQHESGYSTGLLHVATPGADRLPIVHPAIDDLVREAIATPINPAVPAAVAAKLLIVHEPASILDGVLQGRAPLLPRILASRVIVIADASRSTDDIAQQDALLKGMFGAGVTWAATDGELRERLAEVTSIQFEAEVWKPSVAISAWAPAGDRARSLPVIGRVAVSGESQWPEQEDEILRVYPATRTEVVVRVMEPPAPGKMPLSAVPESWELFGIHEMHLDKFLHNLDFLVYFPGKSVDKVPTTAIAWAMAHGIPAILPRSLAARFGKAALYSAPRDVIGLVRRLHQDPAELASLRAEVARQARQIFGPGIHRTRLRRLAGPPSKPSGAPAVVTAPSRQRVLFFSSNGVGLGHLTRLLAIARRMPATIEPVFATLSQALSVVEQAGYPVEYLPFHVYANCDLIDWNEWLAEHLSQIIDFHGARAVVFDAGMPYGGLLRAVAPRRDVKLVWVRRGMWRKAQDNDEAIRRQRLFDLVIEPGEVAETVDEGATAAHRAAVFRVPPISLLDPEELLDRATAAARLGLDPARPAVLIQIGSGWDRDLVSMADTMLNVLRSRAGLQPFVAEWLMSGTPLDLWPGVPRLRGFPIARYYNAFDFTISSAGYNSFNEIILFELPAIFVAAEHAMLDDQNGRATFAEDNGAAVRVPERQPGMIESVVDLFLNEQVRWVMKVNCGRLARGNGAGDAARAIAQLIE